MLVFLRNLNVFHRIQAFIYDIGGDKHLEVSETKPEGDLIEFWIRRLEGVLAWLKSQRRLASLEVPSYRVQSYQPEFLALSPVSNVSERSVSPILESSSKYPQRLTLSVPKRQPTISLVANQSNSR